VCTLHRHCRLREHGRHSLGKHTHTHAHSAHAHTHAHAHAHIHTRTHAHGHTPPCHPCSSSLSGPRTACGLTGQRIPRFYSPPFVLRHRCRWPHPQHSPLPARACMRMRVRACVCASVRACMWACMHESACVRACTCMCAHACKTRVCTRARVPACMHEYLRIHVRACVCVAACLRACMHACVCMCTFMRACAWLHACVRACVCVHAFVQRVSMHACMHARRASLPHEYTPRGTQPLGCHPLRSLPSPGASRCPARAHSPRLQALRMRSCVGAEDACKHACVHAHQALRHREACMRLQTSASVRACVPRPQLAPAQLTTSLPTHPPTHLRRRCCSSCRVQSTRPRIDPFPPRHYTVLRLCASGGTDSFIGVLARTFRD